jgi:hypothetical protein
VYIVNSSPFALGRFNCVRYRGNSPWAEWLSSKPQTCGLETETPNLAKRYVREPSTFFHDILLSTLFPPPSLSQTSLIRHCEAGENSFVEQCIAGPCCSPFSFHPSARSQPWACSLPTFLNPRIQFPTSPRCEIDPNAPTTAALDLLKLHQLSWAGHQSLYLCSDGPRFRLQRPQSDNVPFFAAS